MKSFIRQCVTRVPLNTPTKFGADPSRTVAAHRGYTDTTLTDRQTDSTHIFIKMIFMYEYINLRVYE